MTEAQEMPEEDFSAMPEEPPMTGPERRCIATGSVLPKADLLRFVVSPSGEVVFDAERKLPGRGIWLSPRRDMVHIAVAKRLFAKAARRQVRVADDLADRIEAMVGRRCLDTLALARRAGQAVCGYEKVRAELKGRRVAILLEARDAAADGHDKIMAVAGGVPMIGLFDSAELGQPFGRAAAVHVSVAEGGLARRLWVEAGFLAGFRDGVMEAGVMSATLENPSGRLPASAI